MWLITLVCWAVLARVVWSTRGARNAAEAVRSDRVSVARAIAKGTGVLTVVMGVICVAVTVAAVAVTVMA